MEVENEKEGPVGKLRGEKMLRNLCVKGDKYWWPKHGYLKVWRYLAE